MKSNYVIFWPYQKKVHNPVRISMFDNETNKSVNLQWTVWYCIKYLQSWTKFLGHTNAFLGHLPILTQVQPLPSPHKQCWTSGSRTFFWVSTLYRVGGGRTVRKFLKWCTVLRGNREMIEKYEYWSTVPRTFVQDCTNLRWLVLVFSHGESTICTHPTPRCTQEIQETNVATRGYFCTSFNIFVWGHFWPVLNKISVYLIL